MSVSRLGRGGCSFKCDFVGCFHYISQIVSLDTQPLRWPPLPPFLDVCFLSACSCCGRMLSPLFSACWRIVISFVHAHYCQRAGNKLERMCLSVIHIDTKCAYNESNSSIHCSSLGEQARIIPQHFYLYRVAIFLSSTHRRDLPEKCIDRVCYTFLLRPFL